jgi:prepilin-type processing-associated H-X9-DG protein
VNQITAGVHLYAEDYNNTLPSSKPNSTGVVLKFVRSYVGLSAPASPRDKIFTCPADVFYFEGDMYAHPGNNEIRVSAGLHLQATPYGFTSYTFNGGNMNPLFPGVAGMKLNSIKAPVRTVLIAEIPACWPYSWHQPSGNSHANNIPNNLGFADGHVKYTKMLLGHKRVYRPLRIVALRSAHRIRLPMERKLTGVRCRT